MASTIRLPPHVHAAASEAAAQMGVSLNALVAVALDGFLQARMQGLLQGLAALQGADVLPQPGPRPKSGPGPAVVRRLGKSPGGR